MRKVVVVQDDSSHWYVIPKELEDKFNYLLNDEDFEEDFDIIFAHYRTGGDLNNIQLYADI